MENEIQKKPLTCPVCGAPDPAFFMRKSGCMLYTCKGCALRFVYPVPEVAAIYNDDYFSGAPSGHGYADYDRDKEPMVPTFEEYLRRIKRYAPMGSRLLDVGAATGFFLHIAKRFGFEPYGVEIAEYAAARGRASGLPLITGTLADVPHEPRFAVITLFDVIEHVVDPRQELQRVHTLLEDGGLCVINTPDAGSGYARMMGKRWHLIVPPEHLYYFNRTNMCRLLAECGFEILEVTTIGKRFSLPYIFKTLYAWQHLALWRWLERLCESLGLGRWYLPINLRDNMFVIARKV